MLHYVSFAMHSYPQMCCHRHQRLESPLLSAGLLGTSPESLNILCTPTTSAIQLNPKKPPLLVGAMKQEDGHIAS